MNSFQTTIKKEVTLTGVGLIEADVQWVTDTQRGTNLEKNGVKINTSEHVLSALVGLQIDNCTIYLDAPEPPIMDGSSIHFVNALKKAGITTLEEKRDEYIVKEVINYKDEATGSEMTIIPSDTYQITTMVDFGTKVLGTQNATLEDINDFDKEGEEQDNL